MSALKAFNTDAMHRLEGLVSNYFLFNNQLIRASVTKAVPTYRQI